MHRYPNVYGIDMPSRSELVAYNRDTPSISNAIGADLVIFQTLPDLIESVRQFNPAIRQFDCAVFTGHYVTGGVDESYFSALEQTRADNVRVRTNGANGIAHDSVQAPNAGINGKVNGSLPGDAEMQVSSPMNGTDHTVGLHNTWNGSY